MAQINDPKQNDWASTVLKDLEETEINYTFVQIQNMPNATFEKLCKENIKKQAFQYLEIKKLSHEKVKNIEYKKLEMAGYAGVKITMLGDQEPSIKVVKRAVAIG